MNLTGGIPSLALRRAVVCDLCFLLLRCWGDIGNAIWDVDFEVVMLLSCY